MPRVYRTPYLEFYLLDLFGLPRADRQAEVAADEEPLGAAVDGAVAAAAGAVAQHEVQVDVDGAHALASEDRPELAAARVHHDAARLRRGVALVHAASDSVEDAGLEPEERGHAVARVGLGDAAEHGGGDAGLVSRPAAPAAADVGTVAGARAVLHLERDAHGRGDGRADAHDLGAGAGLEARAAVVGAPLEHRGAVAEAHDRVAEGLGAVVEHGHHTLHAGAGPVAGLLGRGAHEGLVVDAEARHDAVGEHVEVLPVLALHVLHRVEPAVLGVVATGLEDDPRPVQHELLLHPLEPLTAGVAVRRARGAIAAARAGGGRRGRRGRAAGPVADARAAAVHDLHLLGQRADVVVRAARLVRGGERGGADRGRRVPGRPDDLQADVAQARGALLGRGAAGLLRAGVAGEQADGEREGTEGDAGAGVHGFLCSPSGVSQCLALRQGDRPVELVCSRERFR